MSLERYSFRRATLVSNDWSCKQRKGRYRKPYTFTDGFPIYLSSHSRGGFVLGVGISNGSVSCEGIGDKLLSNKILGMKQVDR